MDEKTFAMSYNRLTFAEYIEFVLCKCKGCKSKFINQIGKEITSHGCWVMHITKQCCCSSVQRDQIFLKNIKKVCLGTKIKNRLF